MSKSQITINSRLPQSGTTIFTVMSRMASEANAINLGQGFPDFDCDDKLIRLVKKHLEEGKNQYAPLAGVPKLLKTIGKKIKQMYDLTIDPHSQICVTAGATQALQTAMMAFVREGDEVILFEPAYDSYYSQILVAGGTPVPYTMTYPDYEINWNRVKDMITEKTRMVIINTPHNPTGTILRKEDLEALVDIVSGKNIIVLSDEVYEHLIYDGEEHQSVMRYPSLFKQSMAVFSFGKTLHTTGWKLGYIVGPDVLINEFKRLHQWNVFCTNSFLQFAIADYLEDPETYEYLPGFFEKKRDLMTELFKDTSLQARNSEGTYFQLYNYEKIRSDDDITFSKYLTTQVGVAVIPLSPFYTHPPGDKVIRLCFAKKDETLQAAAEKLKL